MHRPLTMPALDASSIVDAVFLRPGQSPDLWTTELSRCSKNETHHYPSGYTGHPNGECIALHAERRLPSGECIPCGLSTVSHTLTAIPFAMIGGGGEPAGTRRLRSLSRIEIAARVWIGTHLHPDIVILTSSVMSQSNALLNHQWSLTKDSRPSIRSGRME